MTSALAVLDHLPARSAWAVMFRTSTELTLIDWELAPGVFSLPRDAAIADSTLPSRLRTTRYGGPTLSAPQGSNPFDRFAIEPGGADREAVGRVAGLG